MLKSDEMFISLKENTKSWPKQPEIFIVEKILSNFWKTGSLIPIGERIGNYYYCCCCCCRCCCWCCCCYCCCYWWCFSRIHYSIAVFLLYKLSMRLSCPIKSCSSMRWISWTMTISTGYISGAGTGSGGRFLCTAVMHH